MIDRCPCRRTSGTLLGLDNGALIVRDERGPVIYVREYDTLRFTQGGGLPGSTLQLTVDGKAGDVAAALTYPTSGLGWRAAYSAQLLEGAACRMRLDALASIANHSGRDYAGATSEAHRRLAEHSRGRSRACSLASRRWPPRRPRRRKRCPSSPRSATIAATRSMARSICPTRA